MRNKYAANHVLLRDDTFYYVRRVPQDLAEHYTVKRLCFSLRTKSYKSAIHASKSVSQRLEDYWFGLRLQKMNIPALQLIEQQASIDDSFIMHHAYGDTLGELEETMRKSYFNITGGEIRTTAQIGKVHSGMPKFPNSFGQVDYLEWFRQNGQVLDLQN